MKCWKIAILVLAVIAVSCSGVKTPEVKLSQKGSLGFWFYVEQDYYNGVKPQGDLVTLVEVPDVFKVTLDSPSVDAAARQAEFGSKTAVSEQSEVKPPSSVVNLEWLWLMENGNRLNLFLPLLPGGQWYHLAGRWDSTNGVFDMFLNGLPLRIPGTKVASWVIQEMPFQPVTEGKIEGIELSTDFWSEADIESKVAMRDHGDIAPLAGYGDTPPLTGIDDMKDEIIYEADFSESGALENWTMEGPGVFETDSDGWMTMESTEIDVGGPGDGHFVFWAPPSLPENFFAEFDFQAISDMGLCIMLFAAKGSNDKDIFDPSLKPRDGHFGGYIRGDIDCYHISYYANIPTNPGRITSNLRKNPGFYLVSNGPPGVPMNSKDIHKVILARKDGRIRLGVDDKTIIDWQDDGVKYGPVHGGGHFALRQMKWMKARYNNFKLWSVK